MDGYCSRVHDVDLHGMARQGVVCGVVWCGVVHISAHGTGMATLFGLRYPRDRLGELCLGCLGII